jgi:ATP-binding cassette, subfamily C, bacterial LapB
LSLVDRILVFDNGKIVADGPADQILTRLRPQPTGPQAPAAQAAGRPINVAV